MTNRVKKGVLFFALSPFAGVACVVVGAVVGAAAVVAGVVTGVTAPGWMPAVGAALGAEQDALALTTSSTPAVPVDNTAAVAEAVMASPETKGLLDAVRGQWDAVRGKPVNG